MIRNGGTRAIYENNEFCRQNVHESLMFLATEGLSYILFATRHFSRGDHGKGYIDEYQKDRIDDL